MLLRKNILLFVLLIQFFTYVIFPQNQEIKFSYITTENGLSQNQVLSIFEDSQGLLWIATQDGLNLYDGYNFKVFRHEAGNENSLLDYAVNTICETERQQEIRL